MARNRAIRAAVVAVGAVGLALTATATTAAPAAADPTAEALLHDCVTRMDLGLAGLRAELAPVLHALDAAGDVVWDANAAAIVVEVHSRRGAANGSAWDWAGQAASRVRRHLGVDPDSGRLDAAGCPLPWFFRSAAAELPDARAIAELVELRVFVYPDGTLGPDWYHGRLLEHDIHTGIGRIEPRSRGLAWPPGPANRTEGNP